MRTVRRLPEGKIGPRGVLVNKSIKGQGRTARDSASPTGTGNTVEKTDSRNMRIPPSQSPDIIRVFIFTCRCLLHR